MGHRIGAAVLGLGVLLGGAQAAHAADRFATAGTLSVGAERLFGVVHTTEAYDQNNTTITQSYTTITLLTSGVPRSGYSIPRIAVDYFPINGLSLGGSVGFMNFSGSRKTEAGGISQETDSDTTTGFVIAPRVGYAIMFTSLIGLWPRGGITYFTAGTDNTNQNALALTAEVPLVISPVPHVAFQVGPTFDLGVSGGREVTNNNVTTTVDTKTNDIGLTAGITAFF